MAKPFLFFDLIENKIIAQCSWMTCLALRCVCKRFKQWVDRTENVRIRDEFCGLLIQKFKNQSFTKPDWIILQKILDSFYITTPTPEHPSWLCGPNLWEHPYENFWPKDPNDAKSRFPIEDDKLCEMILNKVPIMRMNWEKIWVIYIQNWCVTKRNNWVNLTFGHDQDWILFFKWYCCGIQN